MSIRLKTWDELAQETQQKDLIIAALKEQLNQWKRRKTGVKDKNNKEIRNGDILSCYCPTIYKNKDHAEQLGCKDLGHYSDKGQSYIVKRWYKREVYFTEGCFHYVEGKNRHHKGTSWVLDNNNARKSTIIGNIYNKEG